MVPQHFLGFYPVPEFRRDEIPGNGKAGQFPDEKMRKNSQTTSNVNHLSPRMNTTMFPQHFQELRSYASSNHGFQSDQELCNQVSPSNSMLYQHGYPQGNNDKDQDLFPSITGSKSTRVPSSPREPRLMKPDIGSTKTAFPAFPTSYSSSSLPVHQNSALASPPVHVVNESINRQRSFLLQPSPAGEDFKTNTRGRQPNARQQSFQLTQQEFQGPFQNL